MHWTDAVNRFWFDELRPDDWFSARPEVDSAIRARFGDLRTALKHTPPDVALLDPGGHVAAVIVFDQFSRNLFRKSPEAYATDEVALALARHAVDEGLDRPLDAHRRQFLYMPFMHSEDRDVQRRSVVLFDSIGLPDVTGYAEHHRRIVDRFGRFPHRNAILGRVSTDEERDFLRSEPTHP